MAQNQTIETRASVAKYLKTIKDEKRRKDVIAIVKLMAELSGFEPKMWGPAIIGFGSCHYKYESGREGDMPLIGLASRVNSITLYLSTEFDQRKELLSKLGKYKLSMVCIYIKQLEDIDTGILAKMIKNSIAHTRKKYPE